MVFMKNDLRTLDLFAGIGGIRLGFEKAGFVTVFANDFEEKCKDTYDLNFKKVPLTVKDLQEVSVSELPDFDFLLGGFPCQPFSVAGYRKGFEDKRGNLFFDIVRILEAKRPTGFLLENVKNLRGHDGGNTFRVICSKLDELGYEVKSKILNSVEYGGVPQNRERIYIVGFRKKLRAIERFSFPKPIKLKKSIVEILHDATEVEDKYYYNSKPLWNQIGDFAFEEGKVYQWRRKYIRENKSGVCPTLTANMGMGGHNVPIVKDTRGVRKLTPRECARLQGFPDSYKLPEVSDAILYKQLGNSVTVPVLERIAKNMKKALLI